MDESLRVAEPAGIGYQFEPLSQRVIGAAIEVLRRLGPGFREEIYHNALGIELGKRDLRYERGVVFPVFYDGVKVGEHELDLLVEKSLVVELKAVSCFLEVHQAQLTAYLHAADVRV